MTARRVDASELNSVMEFGHVIRVHPDGTISEPRDVWAPGLCDSELESSSPWSLLDGFSGQDRYSGPIMHASEFVGGGIARYILDHPGYYVTLVDYPSEDDEPDGWAIAYMDAELEQ